MRDGNGCNLAFVAFSYLCAMAAVEDAKLEPLGLVDAFGRKHDYLRISLVDKCNLRCSYCMPENIQFLPNSKLMNAQEILGIVKVFKHLGVKKLRLTGGEPLLRKDFAEIMDGLGGLGLELAITTNGILLHKHLNTLKKAGLRSLNISLDSLDATRFQELTRRDEFARVKANIALALAEGMRVKLNMVVLRETNVDELEDFVELGRHAELHVRFIEFMPFDGNGWDRAQVVTQAEMLAQIASKYTIEKLTDKANSTSRAFQVKGFVGTFAIISTVSQPFCEGCNRLRLTAEGKMRNCLFAKEEADLLATFRAGGDIEPLIRENLGRKAAKLGGLPELQDAAALEGKLSSRAMVKIGG